MWSVHAADTFPAIGNQSTGKSGANLAYNIGTVGIGVDYRLKRSINLRADYEFERWVGFRPNDLTPTILEFGVAFHFH